MHKQWRQRTNPNYTYRKGNVFYFRRKIPSDPRCHYNRPVFVQSLRTTSPKSAEKIGIDWATTALWVAFVGVAADMLDHEPKRAVIDDE